MRLLFNNCDSPSSNWSIQYVGYILHYQTKAGARFTKQVKLAWERNFTKAQMEVIYWHVTKTQPQYLISIMTNAVHQEQSKSA